MGELNFQGVIIPIQNNLYKWGKWTNPNIILIKLYCISNKCTLKFHRINNVDGSTLMFFKKSSTVDQNLTKLLEYINNN